MLFFLTTQPLWVSGAILVGFTTVLAMLGPWVVRRYVALEQLTTHNDIAGFKFAAISVLYAVLLAFAIILVWQKFSDADATVAQEAGAAEAVYRLSNGIAEKSKAEVRRAVTAYLSAAIDDDWPAMNRGIERPGQSSRRALDELYADVVRVEPTLADVPIVSEILHQLDVLTQARRARLIVAQGVVPNVIWLVLFGGALLTVAFTFFFGTENLRAQTVMTAVLSIIIFSELEAIVTIDRPFSGPIRVEPRALANVLLDFRAGAASDATGTDR